MAPRVPLGDVLPPLVHRSVDLVHILAPDLDAAPARRNCPDRVSQVGMLFSIEARREVNDDLQALCAHTSSVVTATATLALFDPASIRRKRFITSSGSLRVQLASAQASGRVVPFWHSRARLEQLEPPSR